MSEHPELYPEQMLAVARESLTGYAIAIVVEEELAQLSWLRTLVDVQTLHYFNPAHWDE